MGQLPQLNHFTPLPARGASNFRALSHDITERFQMLRQLSIILAGLIAISAPAVAQNISVDESFRTGLVRWSGGTPARFEIAWKFIRTSDGGAAICGAWTLSNLQARQGARGLLRGGTVLADGEVIHRNLSQFKRGNARNGLTGSEARCIAIDIPANTQRLGIDLGSGRFRL